LPKLSAAIIAELVFVLQQELTLYDLHQQQIAACDTQIEQCLLKFDAKMTNRHRMRKQTAENDSKCSCL